MSDGYGTVFDTMRRLERFPPIDAEKYTERINALFPAYVFTRKTRKEIEIWTSCCRQHRVEPLTKRTMTDVDNAIRWARHNEEGWCPYCHRPVTVKEAGRLGKRKNLCSYLPAVILSAKDGDLYARAYWCRKDYKGELNAAPEVYSPSCYIFSAREHKAEQIIYPETDCISRMQSGKYKVDEPAICEPFTEGGWCYSHYVDYEVFGEEEITKSDLRYAQWARFKTDYDGHREPGRGLFLMRFLTIAAIYPDKVEMLLKSGLGELVEDMVKDRKKHAAWFNWDAADLKHAFRISRQELRQITEQRYRLWWVDQYVKVRCYGVTLPETAELCKNSWEARDMIRMAKSRRLDFKELLKYLRGQVKKQTEKYKQNLGFVFRHWKDYLEMAEELGWDLKTPPVIYPPRLNARHDEAMDEIRERRAREAAERQRAWIGQLEQLRLEHEKQLAARREKYNIEAGGYLIRVAESGEEIVREGATLQHCVGGYAERHLAGKLTILFLRRIETPEASLYTIEMAGDRLVQIHGFRNDASPDGRGPKPTPPREKMDWLLTPWLAWLENGSKRDKGGRPLLRIEKTELQKEMKTA